MGKSRKKKDRTPTPTSSIRCEEHPRSYRNHIALGLALASCAFFVYRIPTSPSEVRDRREVSATKTLTDLVITRPETPISSSTAVTLTPEQEQRIYVALRNQYDLPSTISFTPVLSEVCDVAYFAPNEPAMREYLRRQQELTAWVQSYFRLSHPFELHLAHAPQQIVPCPADRFVAYIVASKGKLTRVGVTARYEGRDRQWSVDDLVTDSNAEISGNADYVVQADGTLSITHDSLMPCVIPASIEDVTAISVPLEYLHHASHRRFLRGVQLHGTRPTANGQFIIDIDRETQLHEGVVHGCALVALEEGRFLTPQQSLDILNIWGTLPQYPLVSRHYIRAKQEGAREIFTNYLNGQE
ncbi:MAG TPA: hypothetical protein VJH22_02580 [Candidatus Nanoarchaeia archaeon]|nr:hypothetical protein [Candidatus Nanoarchaeia archaeon]